MDHEVDYEEPFGQYLKRMLAQVGLNQRQAALKLGVTPGMMNNWIKGNKRPNPENAMRLAGLLTVDIDDLMIRAGHRRRRDTDLHPKRAELLELARQLPLEQADIAIDYMRWHLDRSLQPHISRQSEASSVVESEGNLDP